MLAWLKMGSFKPVSLTKLLALSIALTDFYGLILRITTAEQASTKADIFEVEKSLISVPLSTMSLKLKAGASNDFV